MDVFVIESIFIPSNVATPPEPASKDNVCRCIPQVVYPMYLCVFDNV